MLPKFDMKNYVYGTRVIKDDLTSNSKRYNPKTNKEYVFNWTLKKYEWHKAIDWKRRNTCGNGLHFWPDGEGDYTVTDCSEKHIWLLVRAKKDEVVYLNQKAKAKALQVLDWGNSIHVNNLMSQLKPTARVNFANYNKYSSTKMVGGYFVNVNTYVPDVDIDVLDEANIDVGYNAKIKCGNHCIITVADSSSIECGSHCFIKLNTKYNVRLKIGYGTQILVRNTVLASPTDFKNSWLKINDQYKLEKIEV